MRAIQLLLPGELKAELEHGGELALGKRKGRRPFNTKKPLHVVLRSSYAVGALSFRRASHFKFITELLKSLSKRFGVKIYSYSVNSNHVHLVAKGETRKGFQNFFRTFAGLTARKITGAQRGRAFGKRFWNQIFYSKLLQWGKHFREALAYVLKNRLEASGMISYSPRMPRQRASP